jgi:hypothetical protein
MTASPELGAWLHHQREDRVEPHGDGSAADRGRRPQ